MMKSNKLPTISANVDQQYYDFMKFDVKRRGVTQKAWIEAAIEKMMKLYEQEKNETK